MTFTRDAGNRLRYHGAQGRRGNPGVLRVAIVDLTHAIEALTAARDELELSLHADERQRERLLQDAQARLRLGIGFATTAQRGRKPPKRRPPRSQLRLKLR